MRLKLKAFLRGIAFADLAMLMGIAVVSIGVGWIYMPAGLIVAGLCVIVLAVMAAK